LFGSKYAMSALVVAALVFGATPIALAIDDATDDNNQELVTVEGTVTAYLYDDEDEDDDQDDADDDANDEPEDEAEDEDEIARPSAFVIDDETVVEFGPWWYWLTQETSVVDVVQVGDIVEVTGEWEELEDGTTVLCAWKIVDKTDADNPVEITIKEEGRPPWAGGPKALGIDPWPPSE